MTRANIARRQGDDFQGRLFWLKAARLLDPHGAIESVAWETGPKGFNDILVRYHPARAPRDVRGEAILHEHSQCKWHVTAGTFGYQDLTDPAFINATSHSLLQRARDAGAQLPPPGRCRFKLVTNWRLRHDDPLIELVRKESGSLSPKLR